jgi:O-methyltransferase
MNWHDLIKMVVPRPIIDAAIRAIGPTVNQSAYERLALKDFLSRALFALQFNGIDGDYLEFGCHRGSSFCTAYTFIQQYSLNCHMWGFDSFAGLPERTNGVDGHPKWIPGSMNASIETFRSNLRHNGLKEEAYTLVHGFYEQTIGEMRPCEEPTNICMANIDCVMYSSTKSVLKFLKPRLKHGMIIAFDDYYCWSRGELAGERRAMLEEFQNDSQWILAPYIQYGWHGASFIVESRELHRELGRSTNRPTSS